MLTFIIHRWRRWEMGTKFIQKNLVSVHRHITSVIIVLRWVLTWFGLRPNDKRLWMWKWIFNIHKKNVFLDHLCSCQHLWGLLLNMLIFTVSLLQNSMNVSYFLCPVVLFCSLLWPLSTTAKLWLLFWLVVIDRIVSYLKVGVTVCAGTGSVSTGADVDRISVWSRLWGGMFRYCGTVFESQT